jgi:hypothetical protein
MPTRYSLVLIFLFALTSASVGQGNAANNNSLWRSFMHIANQASANGAPATGNNVQRTALQATRGTDELPRKHGQQWWEYNIAPYTSKVTSTARPQQAIIDWILRETGTEIWFSEPFGTLSSDRDKIYVYHTPEVQAIVKDVVKNFVEGDKEQQALGLRMVTVGSPNWRSSAYSLLKPINVQAAGLEAWLVSKENAAVLLSQLRKRSDFREQSAPNLLVFNGQSQTLTQRRPRNYIRSVGANQQPGMSKIDEGFSMQISPLWSQDGRVLDAVIKCHIDQVEQLVPVTVDIPTYANQVQRMQVQVPQMVSWRLHERFRWPTDKILLLSCGVVATPSAEPTGIVGLTNLFSTTSGKRADALLFIESRGRASQALITAPSAAQNIVPTIYNR